VGFNTALGCAEIFSTNQDEVKALLGQEPYATLSEGFKSTVMALSSLHHARCEPWDGIQKERLKTFGRKFESSVPALLINSAFDSATPFKYAEAASKSFRKGVLVKVGCTAHGTVLGGPSPETLACAASILRDVLDQGPAKVDPECLCAE
jgi:pimeloyl-ACP methyl ester carboxylesterase